MSNKIPVEIRKNFTLIDRPKMWGLKCDVCDQFFELTKPGKGEVLDDKSVKMLMEHADTHPIPEEEEQEQVKAAPAPPPPRTQMTPPPPASPEDLAPPPVSAPTRKSNGTPRLPHPSTIPTAKLPHAYMVEMRVKTGGVGLVLTVSNFREPDFDQFKQVEKINDTTWRVVLQAANSKHAQLVGERLIRNFWKSQR